MSDRELIWVNKEQAKIFKELDSEENQKSFVDKLISERKIDIQNSIESLDDDLLRLKSFTLTYKTELKKVYNEQSKQLEELWEENDGKIHEIKNKIRQIKPELDDLKNEINDINKLLNGISIYNIEKLIEIVHKVNNMSEGDKKLMKDLIGLSQSNS